MPQHLPAPAANWRMGTPLLIDIDRQIVTRVIPSSPLWLRKYAWSIRQHPRLALRRNGAMILWDEWRTSAPPDYRLAIFYADRKARR
jgi:hypothetical protein